jgi:hypothetical protein
MSTFEAVRIAQLALAVYMAPGESVSQVVPMMLRVPHGPLCTVHLPRPLSKSSVKESV